MEDRLGMGVVEIDLNIIDDYRNKLPSFKNKRNDVYEVKEKL